MLYRVVTLKQRPDLEERIDALHDRAWGAELQGASWEPWAHLFDTFAEFQVVLCSPDDDVLGFGHTVPFVWDGTNEDLPTSLNNMIERALRNLRRIESANTLGALAAVVAPEHRGQQLSSEILRAMLCVAAENGLDCLVAPVGPTKKHLYPLTSMDRYAMWTREDGSPLDPWIRVHWRLGAEHLCIAPTTAVSTGTVAQWEMWSGLKLPETGSYIVPGALEPVEIDCEHDVGVYVDPGWWMRHDVRTMPDN